MYLPATLASLVRIPCPVHGTMQGVRVEMDHANAKLKIVDENNNYPVVELPAVVAPSVTAPGLYVDDGYGWEISGTSLICKINYKKVIEITATAIMLFNSNGNKTIHIDLEAGSIYGQGDILENGIGFP